MYTEESVGVDCTVVCLERVPDSVSNAPEVFWSFRVSRKYSGVRSGKVGAHRKDTGNIGNNRGTWEITGFPLQFTVQGYGIYSDPVRTCLTQF